MSSGGTSFHPAASEMAAAIGRTKARTAGTGDGDVAAKAVDTAAMLDELEHLVDGLIEVATGESADADAVANAAQPAMEPSPHAGKAPTAETAVAVTMQCAVTILVEYFALAEILRSLAGAASSALEEDDVFPGAHQVIRHGDTARPVLVCAPRFDRRC